MKLARLLYFMLIVYVADLFYLKVELIAGFSRLILYDPQLVTPMSSLPWSFPIGQLITADKKPNSFPIGWTVQATEYKGLYKIQFGPYVAKPIYVYSTSLFLLPPQKKYRTSSNKQLLTSCGEDAAAESAATVNSRRIGRDPAMLLMHPHHSFSLQAVSVSVASSW